MSVSFPSLEPVNAEIINRNMEMILPYTPLLDAPG
jgi:hypothetical protein